ncbi:MAG: hypothetical protein MUD01_17495 [Chloroflexaceae bacterium]|jgi:hypothetical protein|nr:hypothetical protein [Chloroflexaceae bacterium]
MKLNRNYTMLILGTLTAMLLTACGGPTQQNPASTPETGIPERTPLLQGSPIVVTPVQGGTEASPYPAPAQTTPNTGGYPAPDTTATPSSAVPATPVAAAPAGLPSAYSGIEQGKTAEGYQRLGQASAPVTLVMYSDFL